MTEQEVNEAKIVHSNIEAISFFHKLSEYGYIPKTEKEQAALYKLGQQVGAAMANNLVHQNTNEGKMAKVAAYKVGAYSEYEAPTDDVINVATRIYSEPIAKTACSRLAVAEAIALANKQ